MLKSNLLTDAQLTELAGKVGQQLMLRGWVMATAESCTGGWIAKCATDVAGSSAWFSHSIVSYSNDAKQRLLKVSNQTLFEHGAVSQATVEQMAAGAFAVGVSNLAVAVTGIAGPNGGSAEKPVGTVWMSWKLRDQAAVSECFVFDGNRDDVRRATVAKAFQGLLQILT